MQNHAGYFRTTIEKATVRVLLVGLLVMLVSAGTLFAASQGGVKTGINVQVNPSSRTLDQGDSTSYSVSVASTAGFSGTVALTVAGLPPAQRLLARSVVLTWGSSSAASLNVTTAASTPAGKFDLTVRGTSGATQSAVVVQLNILASQHIFTISGNLAGLLAPGTTLPLNLQISNPNTKSLALSNLSVSVSGVVRTGATVTANLPCGPADYTVIQYSGT